MTEEPLTPPAADARPPVRLDASRAECLVFSFKEGLLSTVAHDLKVRVERLTMVVDAGASTLEARFDARSLRVVCAMREGREDHAALSASDRGKIERTLRDEVLLSARHPEVVAKARWRPAGDGTMRVEGELTLRGVTRPFACPARREGGRWVVEVTLHQPDHGIKPFSAMLGTLRVRPDVRVRVSAEVDVGG